MKKVILLINLIKNLLLLLVMLWDIIILMVIVLYMKQWFVWHKTLMKDIC